MALISIASAHGAPGVTTLAVALAHRLPVHTGRTAVLLEADPDGGTVAARHHMTGPPSFTALAGTARQDLDPADLMGFTTPMASGVRALTGHPAAEQAHAALRAGASNIAAACSAMTDVDVVADLGRLRPGSPARPFASNAACLVIVANPVVEQLVAVADRIGLMEELAPLHLVLVGDRPYSEAEVRRVLGVGRISIVADDARAVAADPGAGSRRRSSWRSSVDELARELAASLPIGEPPDPVAETIEHVGLAAATAGES